MEKNRLSDVRYLNDDYLASNGCDEIYHQTFYKFFYSSGVKDVIDRFNCFWLLEMVILTIRYTSKVKEEDFIVFRLVRRMKRRDGKCYDRKNRFTLIADDGNGNVLFVKQIKYSDFVFDELKLYFENELLMLPEER